jgi:hypothetical protein
MSYSDHGHSDTGAPLLAAPGKQSARVASGGPAKSAGTVTRVPFRGQRA